ncbi:MAG: hypothetical protein FJY83_00785 [Candidatus Aminicenantes bacterium]|nr:hypothetical protein [Candidatus Aminicenantes bacterium]
MALIQGDIFLNVERCNDLLRKAIDIFEAYIQKKLPPKAPEYYQARNFLREGQSFYDDILKKAKLLLGPVPPYSPPDYEQRRAQTLAENKIIVSGQSPEKLREELLGDSLVGKIMTPSEVGEFLKAHFQSQSLGKRKLANIKVRMILDSLKRLSERAQELRLQAQKRFQAEGG